MRRIVVLPDRTRATVRRAVPGDAGAIRLLYDRVYGGKYTLPECTAPAAIEAKIADPHALWTLCFHRRTLVGSVIFAVDPVERLAKAYAAAVLPEMQGRNVMHHMAEASLRHLCDEERAVDVVYATTRTVTFAPQKVLEGLGFRSLGVFPNVRKVARHETHGLSVRLTDRALARRRPRPTILRECREFHRLAREIYGFEEAEILDHYAVDLAPEAPIRFLVQRDETAVRRLWRSYLGRRLLRLSYFPFHEPNTRFHCPEERCEVFMNVNPADGHGAIVGVKGETRNLVNVFHSLADSARAVGVEYMELLVSAFDPDTQRQALDARFLPCAYFPAMKKAYESDERLDYLCFSRSFVNLDFTELHLVEENRRFLEAFMGCWYSMRLRFGPSFEEMMEEEEPY